MKSPADVLIPIPDAALKQRDAQRTRLGLCRRALPDTAGLPISDACRGYSRNLPIRANRASPSVSSESQTDQEQQPRLVSVAGRGHALTIDAGWRDVAGESARVRQAVHLSAIRALWPRPRHFRGANAAHSARRM